MSRTLWCNPSNDCLGIIVVASCDAGGGGDDDNEGDEGDDGNVLVRSVYFIKH